MMLSFMVYIFLCVLTFRLPYVKAGCGINDPHECLPTPDALGIYDSEYQDSQALSCHSLATCRSSF